MISLKKGVVVVARILLFPISLLKTCSCEKPSPRSRSGRCDGVVGPSAFMLSYASTVHMERNRENVKVVSSRVESCSPILLSSGPVRTSCEGVCPFSHGGTEHIHVVHSRCGEADGSFVKLGHMKEQHRLVVNMRGEFTPSEKESCKAGTESRICVILPRGCTRVTVVFHEFHGILRQLLKELPMIGPRCYSQFACKRRV